MDDDTRGTVRDDDVSEYDAANIVSDCFLKLNAAPGNTEYVPRGGRLH